MERRLAAILAADVVGYTRLMGADEPGTLARLEGLRAEVLDPVITEHRGRVVKLMGDGFLVEFASVVDALNCALDWQSQVEAQADQVAEDQALRFRIGVNLGDIMVKDDDVYGDGVNLAARLEAMAESGAVLVSRTVFSHAKGKVPANFEDLGEQELKNIAEPVQVFRVTPARRGAMLELSILGGFEVCIGRGEPITLPTRKARALLAYLALNPDEAISRSSLAALLWSDRGEPQANNSLSQAVSAIRKALAGVTPSPLIVEPDSLKIEGSAVAVDVLTFDALTRSDDLGDLDRAESIYRGELLKGIGVRDPAFEDWLEFERRRLHALAVGALTKLLELRRDEGQCQELIATAERLLKLDPLQEAAHRALMHCYAEQEQIGLALAQYETCAEVLKRELGVEPDGNTKRVREAIVGQRPASSALPITPDAPAAENTAAPVPSAKRPLIWPLVAAGLAVLAIVAGIAFWQRPWEPREEPASEANMAFPLPDKPSIAVMPFNNLSDDASQGYFADGMTEDLITDLSKISGLFVIARNSSFSYKGKQVKVRQVAEDLGVRYVLEGSVRRIGDEVRINVQLIDATTGGHLWAERYDGTLIDVFDLQDQVARRIVDALALSLTGKEETEVARPETENIKAYDAFLQGWDHYQRGTPEEFRKAIPFFRKAFDFDPEYGRAYAALAAVYWNAMWNRWNRRLGLSLAQSSALIQKYLQVAEDRPSPLAYQVSSEFSAHYRRKPERAIADAEHAIALDANNPTGHLALANALIKAERPTEAVAHMREAMRLDPYYPPSYLTRLGQAQFAMGEFEEAAATLERAASRNPHDDWNYVFLAAAYGNLGRKKEAIDAIAQANELRSSLSRAPVSLSELKNWIYKWTGDKKSLREGLSKAGVGYDSAEWIQLISSGEQGYVVQRATSIDVTTAKALHERGVVFVDVFWQWVSEHILASHLIEEGAGELTETELLQVVAKNEEVVFCGGEARSAANASAKAVSWGFEKVYYFQGGTQAWKNAGYPVEGWKAE